MTWLWVVVEIAAFFCGIYVGWLLFSVPKK